MTHDEVVAALRVIAAKGMAIKLSKDDLQTLKGYNLIEVARGEENERSPACTLTKKGKVMLKANSKSLLKDADTAADE